VATAQAQKKTNFDLFLETVETFRYSQGFYSRLASTIEEWSDEEREQAEEYFNKQPQWNDTLDCILFLEC
jgi:hypothetical protein